MALTPTPDGSTLDRDASSFRPVMVVTATVTLSFLAVIALILAVASLGILTGTALFVGGAACSLIR